jgi:hypothetical protein
VTPETTVYEPTAGNGALLIEANPEKTEVNEINPARQKNLEDQGFQPTSQDAAYKGLFTGDKALTLCLPTRRLAWCARTARPRTFDMSDIQPGYKTNEIDHAIALRALASMKDDGKAVLIIGGISKQLTENEKRSDAYNGRAKREFFKALYDRYKVVDHLTVAGELYAKQGAAWPVDVIVIHGRGKSARSLPAVDVPRVLKTWEDVGKVLPDANARGSAEPVRSGAGEAAEGAPSGGPAEQHGGVSQPTGRSGTRSGTAAGERPARVRGQPVQQPRAEPAPGERTVAPGVPEPGRAGAEAAPGGRPSGLSAEDFGKAFDEYLGPAAEPAPTESRSIPKDTAGGIEWMKKRIAYYQAMTKNHSGYFDSLIYENGKGGQRKEDLSQVLKVAADLEHDYKQAMEHVGRNDGADDKAHTERGRPWSGELGIYRDHIKYLVDRLESHPKTKAQLESARKPRTTAEVAKATVTSAVDSADAALAGLSALFGGPKTSMGLSFDPETYAKAKPLFARAAEQFGQFKDNLVELMRRMLAELETVYGMTKDQLAKMRPYVIQFMQDVQSGAVNLAFPETKATEKPAPKQGMKKDIETENQVSYTASSEGPGLGTLLPVNLKRATDEALAKLQEKVGNLDEFVRDELGYSSKDEMWEGLGAEQVDGIAMMIDGMKRNLVAGSIIGDQTGIGKGRQVAAMIRWAIRNNRVPVFFTAGPKLYVEMYDDMKQIGMGKMLGRNPRILVTNTDLKLPLDREDPSAKISTLAREGPWPDPDRERRLRTSLKRTTTWSSAPTRRSRRSRVARHSAATSCARSRRMRCSSSMSLTRPAAKVRAGPQAEERAGWPRGAGSSAHPGTANNRVDLLLRHLRQASPTSWISTPRRTWVCGRQHRRSSAPRSHLAACRCSRWLPPCWSKPASTSGASGPLPVSTTMPRRSTSTATCTIRSPAGWRRSTISRAS